MAKTNPNLHAVLTIKNMAGAIAKHGLITRGQGDDLAQAYERVRAQAMALNELAWPEDAGRFASEFPGVDPPRTQAVIVGGPPAYQGPLSDQERGNRAK